MTLTNIGLFLLCVIAWGYVFLDGRTTDATPKRLSDSLGTFKEARTKLQGYTAYLERLGAEDVRSNDGYDEYDVSGTLDMGPGRARARFDIRLRGERARMNMTLRHPSAREWLRRHTLSKSPSSGSAIEHARLRALSSWWSGDVITLAEAIHVDDAGRLLDALEGARSGPLPQLSVSSEEVSTSIRLDWRDAAEVKADIRDALARLPLVLDALDALEHDPARNLLAFVASEPEGSPHTEGAIKRLLVVDPNLTSLDALYASRRGDPDVRPRPERVLSHVGAISRRTDRHSERARSALERRFGWRYLCSTETDPTTLDAIDALLESEDAPTTWEERSDELVALLGRWPNIWATKGRAEQALERLLDAGFAPDPEDWMKLARTINTRSARRIMELGAPRLGESHARTFHRILDARGVDVGDALEGDDALRGGLMEIQSSGKGGELELSSKGGRLELSREGDSWLN